MILLLLLIILSIILYRFCQLSYIYIYWKKFGMIPKYFWDGENISLNHFVKLLKYQSSYGTSCSFLLHCATWKTQVCLKKIWKSSENRRKATNPLVFHSFPAPFSPYFPYLSSGSPLARSVSLAASSMQRGRVVVSFCVTCVGVKPKDWRWCEVIVCDPKDGVQCMDYGDYGVWRKKFRSPNQHHARHCKLSQCAAGSMVSGYWCRRQHGAKRSFCTSGLLLPVLSGLENRLKGAHQLLASRSKAKLLQEGRYLYQFE